MLVLVYLVLDDVFSKVVSVVIVMVAMLNGLVKV